jgi:hypothetical protein
MELRCRCVPWVLMKRAAGLLVWTERAARRAAPKERAMATIVMTGPSERRWIEDGMRVQWMREWLRRSGGGAEK